MALARRSDVPYNFFLSGQRSMSKFRSESRLSFHARSVRSDEFGSMRSSPRRASVELAVSMHACKHEKKLAAGQS